MSTDLPTSEACERNKGPILEVLRTIVADGDTVLEIGCGTGQHAVHLAANLPVRWIASDRPGTLEVARRRIEAAALDNMEPPLTIDVGEREWPVKAVDGVFSANTAHIMTWPEVEAMLAGVAGLLPPGGWFALYGPFNYEGRFTSEGNRQLDAWARSLNPGSGVRDFEQVIAAAGAVGLDLQHDNAMPANNRLLEFRTGSRGKF